MIVAYKVFLPWCTLLLRLLWVFLSVALFVKAASSVYVGYKLGTLQLSADKFFNLLCHFFHLKQMFYISLGFKYRIVFLSILVTGSKLYTWKRFLTAYLCFLLILSINQNCYSFWSFVQYFFANKWLVYGKKHVF